MNTLVSSQVHTEKQNQNYRDEQSKAKVKRILEVKLNERVEKRVQPPFTALQSFNAAALILSYLDYQEDVEPLLN